MSNFKTIISDFILFIKKPNKLSSEISFTKKIKTVLILFGFGFLLNIIAGIALSLIFKHFQIDKKPTNISITKVFSTY